jgi:soluble lytic murein transglycosylase
MVGILDSVQQGQSFADGLFQTQARRTAGAALAAGDYGAAANTMFRRGDLAAGQGIRDQQRTNRNNQIADQTADRGRQLASTLGIVRALKSVRDQGGDILQAVDQYRPALLAMGTDPADLDQIIGQVAQNPAFLDQIEQITATQQAEWEFRDGGAGDVVAVRTGADGPESRLIYDAPDRPISTPYGIILPPTNRTPVANGAPAPQPNGMPAMTGPAISGGPLWDRQERQESGGRQFASNGQPLTSPAGAFGVAQLMPGTAAQMAREMGVSAEELRTNPDLNRAAGQRYMDQQLERYGGNQALALAAYNAGPGRVDEWIQRFGDPRTGEITTEEWAARIPFQETRQYVANITGGQFDGAPATAQGDQGAAPTQDLGGGWQLQQMETPADRRAARTEQRMDRNEARDQARFEQSMAPVNRLTPAEVAAEGLPEGSVVERRADNSLNVVSRGGTERFTEGQRASAAFSFRVENAARALDALSEQGVIRPSPAILAFGDGRIRENALSSTDRRFLQASREWLAPILRKDTGAAVTPQELVTYLGIYLPSPTDDAATLAQKARAREVAQQALRAQAGGAYSDMFPDAGRDQPATPRLRFEPNPEQIATARRIDTTAARLRGEPLGSRNYPRYLNPRDPRASYNNIPVGQYYISPDGQVRQRTAR